LFQLHFDNLTSNSRFRDDLALFFGVNRQLGWRYNSTLDKLVLTSGSAHTLTLDGDGNVSGSGNISASFFHGDGSGLSNISATLPAEVVSASAGHITASGDISSSGNLSAGGGTLFLGDDVSIFDDGTNILRTDDIFHANNNIHVGGDGKLIDRADTDNFIELASIINKSTDISVTGDVTASGVISASGDGHIFGGAVGIGTSPLT
jgi:hypothetical protein